ncbi:MAG: DUF1330 domain-containing protein [Sphingomonadales bacterium]|nr:DUF1330 domain-containing protein [Sphingomonadales bacterium]MDE2568663.1 DUF1330 domain-containing protein [Sphingomonadales bacterium]
MSGYVDPSRDSFQAFKDLPRDTPIHMLNLLRFKALADYPEGHPDHGSGLTGAEAYREYARSIQPILARVGAAMVWQGRFECVVTGPAGEWDDAFVMGYPSAAAFLAMVTDPEYQQHVAHRTAAVEDSRLIRFGEG